MKTHLDLRLFTLIIFTLLSCDATDPAGGEDGLFTSLSCQEIVAEQNYNAWCGADGSGIRATVIGGTNLSCTFSVKYQDLEVPAYFVSIQLLNSAQAARLFIDDLSRVLYQKISDVHDLGDEAVYFQTDNADSSRAFVVRSANAVATVTVDRDSNSPATCIREIDELKSFVKQVLLNLEV